MRLYWPLTLSSIKLRRAAGRTSVFNTAVRYENKLGEGDARNLRKAQAWCKEKLHKACVVQVSPPEKE